MPDSSSPLSPHDERDPIVNLADVWDTLRTGRWLILAVTICTIGLGTALSVLLPPLYSSEAVLRISTQDATDRLLGDLAPLAKFGLGLGLGDDGIETDIGVLRSRQISQAVVDSLGLQVRLREPRRARDQLLALHEVRRDAVEASYSLQRQSDGSYTIRVAGNLEPVRLPERIEIGTAFSVGGVTLALDPRMRDQPPERIRFTVQHFDDAVARLRRELRIGQSDSRSRLVEVRYRSRDPLLVAAVPNAAVNSFIHYKRGTSKSETRSTAEVLRGQIAHYEADLRRAEERLQGFREQQQVVDLPEQAAQQVRRMAEIQVRHDGLRVERESLAQLLAEVDRGQGRLDAPSPYRQLATLPSFISNRAVQDILHSLVQLENQRAQLLVRRTPESVDVRGITERVNELELQLYQLATNYLASLDNEIRSANSVMAGFGSEFGSIPAREIEFLRLMREQKMLEEVYQFLQLRLKEAEVQEAVEQGDVRIVDLALVPRRPIFPRLGVNLLLATTLGLMLGTTLAIGRRALDPRIRSRKDVVTAANGVPLLAVIPHLGETGRWRPALRRWRGRLGGAANAASNGEVLVARHAPDSVAADAYRALRTHLLIAAAEQEERVLVLTSVADGEGKTTTAANLALSLAQQGTRVLLVDADLRRGGTLHELFAVQPARGLAEILGGTAALDEAIQNVDSGGALPLHCLFSGRVPSNPAELLASHRTSGLVEQLRADYEIVIFDAPPLDGIMDAAVLGRAADAVLIVVRADTTEKVLLQEGITQLHGLGVPAVGLLLNGFTGKVRRRARRIARHTAV